MGCGCGGGSSQASFPKQNISAPVIKPVTPTPIPSSSGMGVMHNLAAAFKGQPNKLQWIKEGALGLLKCAGEVTKYTDEEIVKNRDVCRECPHSTKREGKLIATSQCMAPDPKRGGVPCGCFVMCKTQSGDCPINKWTHLTISAK